MKKLAAALFLFYWKPITSIGQTAYWQQQVNYTIDVTLNDKEKTLDGFEKLEYSNHSPDTLHFIWFHLWPNAYKNDKTAFNDQLLENGNTKFYFSNKEKRGYINRLDFKVNNITTETEDHPQHIDIIKVKLPSPLAPGQTIIISTPFHVKLPYNFSRGGYDGDSYQVTQWYPKPAVYDAHGWHEMPYLDQGEFYSEFGNFDVQITLPKNYVVAATGELQNTDEKQWLNTRRNFSWNTVSKKIKSKGGITKTVNQLFPPSDKEIKTIRYKQDNIHDFAWFADKRFIVMHDTCALYSGKVIDVYSYYTQKEASSWKSAIAYSKDAIRFYSEKVGEYPYPVASVLQGPQSFGGGMEYPTITAISPGIHGSDLDDIIAHELGHNWFYSILASDERTHPWMDEGINSFYESKYSAFKKNDLSAQQSILFETKATVKTDQPIETPSEKFSYANYGLVAYYKTAAWMRWLEATLGKEKFQSAMQAYFKEWQFRHPQPEDFKKSIEKNSGENLDSVFSYLDKTGLLPDDKRKGATIISIFQPEKFISEWQNRVNPKKNIIRIGPAFGFNSYDKFMVGGLITNYSLPPTKFKFFFAPMYATGSKKFTGIGTVHYTFYPTSNLFHSIDLFTNAATFNTDYFKDSLDRNHYTGFQKFVPGFRIVFKENNPRSTVYKAMQWKTFMIREQNRDYAKDTIIAGTDTSVADPYRIYSTNRTLNQLKLIIEDNRALYPYKVELNAEQGKGFIRLAFTSNYFFNYGNNKGGVDVRFFAGKFFYVGSRKANSDLYALNLSAPKGNLDYTYSDYFIGRNKTPFLEGSKSWPLAYQQIMVRDGGLKMNTEAQQNYGTSDDWISSINATFDIPIGNSDLRMFPLKVFFDIGTYAEVWKKNTQGDRFLYDAGIQLSLLKDLLNIYVPLIYSPVYKDYLKSDFIGKNRFLKSISFSINVANFNLRKIDRNLVF